MTTTVGLVFKEGVVLGTDSRATMGRMIACKDAQKVYKLTENIAMTTAGGVGDAQTLVRNLSAEYNLIQLRTGKQVTVNAAATFLSNVLSNNRGFPFEVQLLLAGVDKNGPSLFSVDAVGGITKESVTATGSGSPTAYGVLEDRFKSDMSEEDAIALAKRAVEAAKARDSASGNAIQICVITKEKINITETQI
jgi:proteasome beta subunit